MIGHIIQIKIKKDFKYWEVKIGKWHKPWNRELEQDLDRNQKREIKKLSWAEQPQTIKEVGSTFTIQGFDLNYSGVILGPSVKYRNGHIVLIQMKVIMKKLPEIEHYLMALQRNLEKNF